MKKIYIIPETKTVKISVSCPMLAGSEVGYQGNYDSESVTIGSRQGGSFWDDDED